MVITFFPMFLSAAMSDQDISAHLPRGHSFNFMCVMFKCVVVITFVSISSFAFNVNDTGHWRM